MIYFPIKSIKKPKMLPHWFKADVKVKSLRICKTRLCAIAGHVFGIPEFDELEFLEFLQVPIWFIHTSSLEGLKNLRKFRLKGTHFHILFSGHAQNWKSLILINAAQMAFYSKISLAICIINI